MTTAIVTGAANGIGAACARTFVERGYRVVAIDIDPKSLARLHGDLGSAVTPIEGNAADVGVLAKAVEVAGQLGGLDVFLANAGFSRPAPSIGHSRDDWDAMIEVNLTAVFEGARIAAASMSTGGRIVAMASIAAAQGFAGRAAYCATKAGITGLVRALAVEWAEAGITVNAVAPGYIKTDLVKQVIEKGIIDVAALESRIPMGRLGTPENVADAVAFLARPESEYITGTVLYVDGGWTAFGLGERT